MIVSSPPISRPDRPPVEDRLIEFLRPFQNGFRRRDQARWLCVYLRGLLASGPRKTIEAMVRDIEPMVQTPSGDLSQAIQNFLNQSPWDERLIWRELRRAAALRQGPWTAVIEETGIVKQGQHSVGVQRQYAGDLERKQNCQVVSVVMGVSPEGAVPLGMRLYLPRNWATDPNRLDAAGVPEPHRATASRGQLALGVLDEIESDGVRFDSVVAVPRQGVPRELRDGLLRRNGSFLIRVDGDTPVRMSSTPMAIQQVAPPEWTEGVGGLRVQFGEDEAPLWAIFACDPANVRNRPTFHLGSIEPSVAADLLKVRRQSSSTLQLIKTRFGLDHFEGRSWRGFHHHASLVALARWYSFLEQRDAID